MFDYVANFFGMGVRILIVRICFCGIEWSYFDWLGVFAAYVFASSEDESMTVLCGLLWAQHSQCQMDFRCCLGRGCAFHRKLFFRKKLKSCLADNLIHVSRILIVWSCLCGIGRFDCFVCFLSTNCFLENVEKMFVRESDSVFRILIVCGWGVVF